MSTSPPKIVRMDIALVELEGWLDVLSYLSLSKEDIGTNAIGVLAGRMNLLTRELRASMELDEQKREGDRCA